MNKQDRVKRLLGNVVVASTSVTVLVAAASFSPQFQATIYELTPFVDRLAFDIDVSAIDDDVQSTPLRIKLESQWDTLYQDITFGRQQGFIEALRPQQRYTFTIEQFQTLTWSSIVSETFSTRADVAQAAFLAIEETTHPLETTTSIMTQVFIQDSLPNADAWYVQLQQDTLTFTQPMSIGETTLYWDFEQVSNSLIEFSVLRLSGEQLQTIRTTTVAPQLYIDGSLTIFFPSLTTLHVEANIKGLFADHEWVIVLDNDEETLMFPNREDVHSITLSPGKLYQLSWLLYIEANTPALLLLATPIITLDNPLYSLQIININNDFHIEFQIPNLLIHEVELRVSFEAETIFIPLTYQDDGLWSAITPTALDASENLSLMIRLDVPYDYWIVFNTFTL
jgi:hypothetical protein